MNSEQRVTPSHGPGYGRRVAPEGGRIRPKGVLEEERDLVEHGGLVALEADHVVRAPRPDGGDDPPLASGRVDRHDAPLQREQGEELRNGRDLVRLLVGSDLSDDKLLLRRPGADHVGDVPRLRRDGPERLPVDGDDFPSRRRGGLQHLAPHCRAHVVDPRAETAFEEPRVEGSERSVERVVARDAVWQLKAEKPFEPLLAALSERLEVVVALRAADRRAQGDDKHVVQLVQLVVPRPDVRQNGEALGYGSWSSPHRLRLRHFMLT